MFCAIFIAQGVSSSHRVLQAHGRATRVYLGEIFTVPIPKKAKDVGILDFVIETFFWSFLILPN